jgi:2-polyprenyl-3-methyl-5-hydroxy-6-metoxy-1,4-benzoquinol methylase
MAVTRGRGLLEPFLARQRSKIANRLIGAQHRTGRILDIGCGSHPYFLSHTSFKEKFAIDQLARPEQHEEIAWHSLDLNAAPQLPFQDGFFNVVTMLAVIEHLDPSKLVDLFVECRRVLRHTGHVILTTPASWTDNLLDFMARLKLVSKEEIDEHVFTYTLPLIGWYFGAAGFEMTKIQFGTFELGMNLWAVAEKA